MKKYSTALLRCAIYIAAIIILALCGIAAWMLVEAEPTSKYYILKIVFFIGTCVASIPFYTALYQSFKLLRYIDTGHAFSSYSVKALNLITRSALAEFLICTLGGLPFFYVLVEIDDAPGLLIIGMALAGFSFVIFVFASVLNMLLQDAIDIKSENDLTI